MVFRRGNHHAVTECGLFQQRVGHCTCCVAVDECLCHVIVDKGCIRFAIADSFHHLLTGTAHQFFRTGCQHICDRCGRGLIDCGDNMDLPIKVSPRHSCHSHRDIGSGQSPFFGLCVIIRIQSCINTDVYRILIALICDILLSGRRDKKLIRESCIVCYLPKIVRENALYFAIFCIGIGIPGRVAQNMKGILLGILGNDTLFFFRVLQIFGIGSFVVFVIEGRFPAAFGSVHLIDCIIYLIQKFSVSFFDDHIKITAAEFFKDVLIVRFAQGTGDNGINRSILKCLCYLLSRIEIDRFVGEAFGSCILRKFIVPGISAQECNTHPIVGTILSLNDGAIIAADSQDTIVGSDRTGKIK